MIHRIAILSLVVVTLLNIVCTIIVRSGETRTQVFEILVGTAIWGFLTYKIWTRPRKWGFGVGILLLVALALQIHLFMGALSSGLPHKMGVLGHPVVFAIWELPLLLGAISCCLLRYEHKEGSEQEQSR